MKLAFSTVCCPGWDIATIVARAKEYGYDGVELRGFLDETPLAIVDPFQGTAEELSRQFTDAGVKIACLSNSIAMTGKAKVNATSAQTLRKYIDRAEAVGCGLVKLADTHVRKRDKSTSAVALAEWLLPLGDYAAERDVTLVVENEFAFRTAQHLWRMLETLNHPAVAACWDVFNATIAGERPAVSVPNLNSRIQYVHVKDARLDPAGPVYCPIGQGDAPIRDLLIRLSGIGYGGWVTVEWDRATLPNLAPAEDILPGAAVILRKYLTPVHHKVHPKGHADAKPAGAKPVAAGG